MNVLVDRSRTAINHFRYYHLLDSLSTTFATNYDKNQSTFTPGP